MQLKLCLIFEMLSHLSWCVGVSTSLYIPDDARSSFLAMTTLVCRNNTGFDGESRSIAASIRAMAPYNFSWAVYVPKLKLVGNGIQDDSGYPKISGTIWQMKGNLPDSAGSPFHHPSKMDWNRGNEVIVSDASEEGKCPGLESFRELRQANVRMLYRSSVEKC